MSGTRPSKIKVSCMAYISNPLRRSGVVYAHTSIQGKTVRVHYYPTNEYLLVQASGRYGGAYTHCICGTRHLEVEPMLPAACVFPLPTLELAPCASLCRSILAWPTNRWCPRRVHHEGDVMDVSAFTWLVLTEAYQVHNKACTVSYNTYVSYRLAPPTLDALMVL